eukprot:9541601-Prorocentrum_lima.AAC.1
MSQMSQAHPDGRVEEPPPGFQPGPNPHFNPGPGGVRQVITTRAETPTLGQASATTMHIQRD